MEFPFYLRNKAIKTIKEMTVRAMQFIAISTLEQKAALWQG